jgi:hypothetical protein
VRVGPVAKSTAARANPARIIAKGRTKRFKVVAPVLTSLRPTEDQKTHIFLDDRDRY